MPDTRKWYAVYTKPKWEKKVSQLLTKKKIESYCPLNKVVRQWKDRRKLIMEPLFNSYVFVHLTEQEIWSVRQTEGVLNFVYWLSKPAIIQDQEIITIQRFLNDYQNVHLEKARVNPHDTVRVMGGPLMYLEGNVLEVKNKTLMKNIHDVVNSGLCIGCGVCASLHYTAAGNLLSHSCFYGKGSAPGFFC